MNKPLVGISACLLGEDVRYDGDNRLDRSLIDTLGEYLQLVPVCPEVECGMGVPREAMHLSLVGSLTRLMTTDTLQDMTGQMEAWMIPKLRTLADLGLCGFVLRSHSPSCGLGGLRVHREKDVTCDGVGIFARAFTEAFPGLPVEEDVRLQDKRARKDFIRRILGVREALSEP